MPRFPQVDMRRWTVALQQKSTKKGLRDVRSYAASRISSHRMGTDPHRHALKNEAAFQCPLDAD